MTCHVSPGMVRLVPLVLHAWLGLIAFDAARLAGLARASQWLRQYPVTMRRSRATKDEVVWSVEEACVWYVKRAMCLQRSMVATWLLRRQGIRAEMVIGYRPLPFESHAWVEVDGQIVNDRPQYQRAFRVLDRM